MYVDITSGIFILALEITFLLTSLTLFFPTNGLRITLTKQKT